MKEPVRVLVINHVAGLGGAELMLMKFLEGVDRRIIEPTLLCLEDGPLCEWCRELGLPVLIADSNQGFLHMKRSSKLTGLIKTIPHLFGTMKYIGRLAREGNFDLVLTNSVKAHVVGTLGVRRLPIIWRLHDIVDTSTFSPTGVKVMAFAAKKADHISCVSGAVLQALLDMNVPKDKLSVLYNGIGDVSYTGDSFRMEWGIMDHEVVVALIARISPDKGHETFIQAASHLVRTLPSTRFFIVGGDIFAGNKVYTEGLKDLVMELGLGDKVVFTGHISNIPKVLAGIDIFVNASNKPDSLPTAIIEAMLAAKPIVASKIGGIPEMIEDGNTGLLIEPGDSLSLAKAIERLVNDMASAKDMGKKARERALDTFNIDDYVDGMTALLETFKGV